MKQIMTYAAAAMVVAGGMAEAQEYHTGLAELAFTDAQSARTLEGFVWYPTDQSEGAAEVHTNPVWVGIEAVKGAAPAAGRFPLVVVSHGMYGNAMNQTWLASELAQRGYVVAAINHPGTSTWLRDAQDARKLWERPRDISRVIDHVLSAPELAAMVDPDRVFMAGHSLGGFTAMELAGARYDAEKMDAYCADHPGELVCGIFADWQVGKTPDDRTMMEADLSDPRIKGFGVLDLGGTQSFSEVSLAQVTRPLMVFGAPLDIAGLNLDIESRALVAALPAASVTYLEPAGLSHFDFLGICKPGAEKILADEYPGDEIVCREGAEDRQADHAMIVDALTGFFAAH